MNIQPSQIVHIGTGSFFKAHQAEYMQHLHARGDTRWSLSAGSIRSNLNELADQDGRYTLETVSPEGVRRYRRMQSIQRVIGKRTRNNGLLINAGADPNVGILSCTISPKGYMYDASGRLDLENPQIKADIRGTKKTIYGVVSAILKERFRNKRSPIAILSCDNVEQNGKKFQAALLTFMRAKKDLGLLEWTRRHITFPNSMVDRITPATDEALKTRVQLANQARRITRASRATADVYNNDGIPVRAEKYKQWVIEERPDSFPSGRPEWEKAGVAFVQDIGPYEAAKIRILNASHCGAAWFGTVLGKTHIHEAFADGAIGKEMKAFVRQSVIPSLGDSEINLERYHEKTFKRFSSAHIADTTERVGRNASAKIPISILPTIRDLRAMGRDYDEASFLLALHFRATQLHGTKLEGETTDGAATPLVDTMAAKETLQRIFESESPLDAYCAETSLFGNLAGDDGLRMSIERGLKKINEIERAVAPADRNVA